MTHGATVWCRRKRGRILHSVERSALRGSLQAVAPAEAIVEAHCLFSAVICGRSVPLPCVRVRWRTLVRRPRSSTVHFSSSCSLYTKPTHARKDTLKIEFYFTSSVFPHW